MKKSTSLILLTLLLTTSILAQNPGGPLLSGTAPSFSAVSTVGKIYFPEDYFGKWKILFSHPADFTPVCTSEILSLAAMQNDFKKLNTVLIVISTDGLNSHMEWVKSMESINYKEQGLVKIEFPLVSDANLSISRKYGILQSDTSTRNIRSVYFIDPDNQIRAMLYYPLTVGRNIEEIKRTLIALQTVDKNEVLTPANWKPGEDVLLPSPANMREAEKLKTKQSKNLYQLAWYMWFKKL